ncbi:MAG: 3-phosphoshikimate 1-carboxyvinyltransferase [Opitutaceae bacterium]|nr:3-phosphoshikimate 1-carboxyvinyltransferase [Cytophagales bacterium]
MSDKIFVKKPLNPIHTKIRLSSSKSESNRALIINAVSGNKCNLENLSDARDTITMQRLLLSGEKTLDVIDAGTTMRFLIALMAAKGENKILTGTARMCERPVKILVEALRSLGADIDYLGTEGYPPVEIKSFKSKTDKIQIKGDVSSQYISALLMISPLLPNGLQLELTGKVASRPYIEMTLDLMKHFGVSHTWTDNIISISKQEYKANEYRIESDWSGASYWYSVVALAEQAEIELIGLKQNSLQGDSAIVKIMEKLGVTSKFTLDGILLTKQNSEKEATIDFADCPDLAQTVVACAAAKGIKLKITGIESLKIKETDRILALQNELKKYNASFNELSDGWYEVIPSTSIPENIKISTYDDHRMAMAFAPLAFKADIEIEDKHVVNKSYPGYWEDLKRAGFILTD